MVLFPDQLPAFSTPPGIWGTTNGFPTSHRQAQLDTNGEKPDAALLGMDGRTFNRSPLTRTFPGRWLNLTHSSNRHENPSTGLSPAHERTRRPGLLPPPALSPAQPPLPGLRHRPALPGPSPRGYASTGGGRRSAYCRAAARGALRSRRGAGGMAGTHRPGSQPCPGQRPAAATDAASSAVAFCPGKRPAAVAAPCRAAAPQQAPRAETARTAAVREQEPRFLRAVTLQQPRPP